MDSRQVRQHYRLEAAGAKRSGKRERGLQLLLRFLESTDFVEYLAELSEKYPEVGFISTGEPDYGKALRAGIMKTHAPLVLCDEIDLCDTDFHQRAVAALQSGSADMVIGSKLIRGPLEVLRKSPDVADVGRLSVARVATDAHVVEHPLL